MFFSAQFKSGFEDFGFLKPTNYFEAKSWFFVFFSIAIKMKIQWL